jgi:hypothetical protein
MITITQYDGRKATFPADYLPGLSLQLSGGGWTAKQTANAMALQAQLQSTGRAILKRKSGNITVEYAP